jgi:hypothetical protein
VDLTQESLLGALGKIIAFAKALFAYLKASAISRSEQKLDLRCV